MTPNMQTLNAVIETANREMESLRVARPTERNVVKSSGDHFWVEKEPVRPEPTGNMPATAAR